MKISNTYSLLSKMRFGLYPWSSYFQHFFLQSILFSISDFDSYADDNSNIQLTRILADVLRR